MERCGCSSSNGSRPGWDQRPGEYDLTVVAGDSLVVAVSVDWGMAGIQEDMVLAAHIRSRESTTDGWFEDADSPTPLGSFSPELWTQSAAETAGRPPRHPGRGGRGGGSKSLRHPYADPESDFAPQFTAEFGSHPENAEPDLMALPPGGIVAHPNCGRALVRLALTPPMTRHLWNIRAGDLVTVGREPERYTCVHLPLEANVAFTASGYPPRGTADSTGTSWESSVGLPVMGGEYDSRSITTAEGYSGRWDLQVSSTDGRFSRTVVSGTITVVGDVSRLPGTDI